MKTLRTSVFVALLSIIATTVVKAQTTMEMETQVSDWTASFYNNHMVVMEKMTFSEKEVLFLCLKINLERDIIGTRHVSKNITKLIKIAEKDLKKAINKRNNHRQQTILTEQAFKNLLLAKKMAEEKLQPKYVNK